MTGEPFPGAGAQDVDRTAPGGAVGAAYVEPASEPASDVQEAPVDPVTQMLEGNNQVAVLFTADWSPAALLLQRSGLSDNADLTVDVDADPVTADRYQIWSVPTLLIVEARGVRRRVTGAACAEELRPAR